jgi:hypothetical protein
MAEKTSGSPSCPAQASLRSRSASLSRGSCEGNLHSQPNLPARPHDILTLRRVPRPRSVSPLGRIGPFSLLLASRLVPKHTSADLLQASEPLRAQRVAPVRPRGSEEPRGHPGGCRRALPNRIVTSRALAPLRRMGRGSLDSLRDPDEPSADHGSRPSTITLRSSSYGRPSPDIETTRPNLEPPRRSEERSGSLWIDHEPSLASKRHPCSPSTLQGARRHRRGRLHDHTELSVLASTDVSAPKNASSGFGSASKLGRARRRSAARPLRSEERLGQARGRLEAHIRLERIPCSPLKNCSPANDPSWVLSPTTSPMRAATYIGLTSPDCAASSGFLNLLTL